MVFWTAGFQPAHEHDAGWKPAVRKSMRPETRQSTKAATEVVPFSLVDDYCTTI